MEDSVKLNESEIKEAIVMYLESKGRMVKLKPKHRPGDSRTGATIPAIHLYQTGSADELESMHIIAVCQISDG